ncbi:hypothetical protein C2G38_2220449 [Gigaspora rosea]|uniref:Uncharacterized protein n=1 Tax=Gigaspora rosea TaxID=44941 RepID=A0A397U7W4_9GLOM|nr:hypothetical protein C2G38_2220449 [Gigaspora rosea]
MEPNELNKKKEKKENVSVESKEVVDDKLKLILDEKAFKRNRELKIKKIVKPRKVISKVNEHTIIEFTKGTLNAGDKIRVKEDEYKTSKGHLMSAKSGDANGTFMVGNCYLNRKDTNGPSHLGRKDFLSKELEEAAELWMNKVTELKRTIKRDRKNEPKEKKVHHRKINFEEPLNDLNKTLEVKPKDISTLEKKNNKVKNLRLTHFSKKEKEVLVDFDHERKINSNKELPKCANRNNLTEKYKSLKDNRKQEDICATGVTLMVKNEAGNKEKEKDENKGEIVEHKK